MTKIEPESSNKTEDTASRPAKLKIYFEQVLLDFEAARPLRPMRQALLVSLWLSMLTVQPAAAETASEAFCGSGFANLLGGFFSVLTVLGAALGLLTYQYNAVIGMVAQNQETRKVLKERESGIKSWGMKLFSSGPIYFILASVTPLPGLGCLANAIGL